MLAKTGFFRKLRIKDHSGAFLLLGIIGVSFLLRVYNIQLDPPVANKEAHWTFGHSLFSMSLMRDGFVHFPLYQIILIMGDWVHFLFGLALGLFKSPLDFEISRVLNFFSFFIWSRVINVILGVVNVYIIYLIGKKLHGKNTGLVAATSLSFLYPHIEACRIVDLYAALVLFICVAFLFSIDIMNYGKLKSYLLGGFFVGFAAAIGITGIFAIVPFILAHFLRNGYKRLEMRKLYYGLLFVFLGFCLGFPTLPWDIGGLLSHLYNKNNSYLGSVFGYSLPGWQFCPKIIYHTLGPFLSIFSVAAVIYCVVHIYLKKNLLLISFPVFFYAAMCMPKVMREHWLLPIFPFIMLIDAYFLVNMLDNNRFLSRRINNIIMIAVVLLLTAYSAWKTVRYQFLLSGHGIEEALVTYKKIYFPDEATLKKRAVASLKTKKFGFLGIISRFSSKYPIMSSYTGKKVRISGNIICRDYRGGPVFIVVCSFPLAESCVAVSVVDSPGGYVLEVPDDYGEAIILASCLWAGLKGPFADLVVNVGKANMEGIDLRMN